MHRVLMPVDVDETRAAKQAAYLTSMPLDSEAVDVTILFVFQEDDDEMPETFKSPLRVDSVTTAKDALEESGFTVTVAEDSGDPADAILDRADEIDADSILMGGRERSVTGKALFGSVVQSVILNTSRPVVVTGGTEEADT